MEYLKLKKKYRKQLGENLERRAERKRKPSLWED